MRPHLWHKCPTWLPGMGPDRVGQTIGGGGSYMVFSTVLSKIFRGGGPPGWCLQGRSVLFALGVWVSLILIISFQLLLCDSLFAGVCCVCVCVFNCRIIHILG